MRRQLMIASTAGAPAARRTLGVIAVSLWLLPAAASAVRAAAARSQQPTPAALASHPRPAAAAAAPTPAAAQRYELDPLRSTLEFSFTQAGAVSRGTFQKFAATLSCAAAQRLPCAITVTVPVIALNTQDKDRDQLLRGPDLFDIARFPQARFHSSRFEALADPATVRVVGNLTLRDRTRPLSMLLHWRFATEGNSAVAYLSGQTTLNRLDFGVGQREWASTEWVANAVSVKIQLRLVVPSAQL